MGYGRRARVSATYRIEIRRDPHSVSLPFDAVVYRLSDGERMTICVGGTYETALFAAREWVRDEEGTENPHDFTPMILHVDDQGRDAEAPQSVKVP